MARIATKLADEVDNRLYIEGKSRAELANVLGIYPGYLSSILTGKHRLTVQMSKKMADALDMDDRTLRKLALETGRRCAG